MLRILHSADWHLGQSFHGFDEEFASTLADLASLDPEEIMRSAYVERYRCEPDPSLLSALREILSEAVNAK